MSAGQEFWVVAAGDCDKAGVLELLTNSPCLHSQDVAPCKLAIPDGSNALVFGSFDTLVRLTDDLAKADQQLDGMIHRLERQYAEADPQATYLIKTQRQEKKVSEYLASWEWDEAKYPTKRSIADNLSQLMNVATKLDDEVRQKTAQYNEAKTAKSAVTKKDLATLPTVDLVDLLTPAKVQALGSDIFVMTEHLTTVCVIVPRGTAKEFLAQYESFSEMVVPETAYHFKGMDDKDGNALYRVVVFRSGAEAFKKECRAKRFIARDFEYSQDGYSKLVTQREELDAAVQRMHRLVRELSQQAWSDVMVAWVHVKVMRVFVEAVLRYGMSKPIAAFLVAPKPGTAPVARKVLQEVLGTKGAKVGFSQAKMAEAAAEDGEEYYPYISFSFTPLAAKTI